MPVSAWAKQTLARRNDALTRGKLKPHHSFHRTSQLTVAGYSAASRRIGLVVELEKVAAMLSSVQRLSRETGAAIDIDLFKRRTWNGFAAEFVRIPAPARYDFKTDGSSFRISLLDIRRTDGVTAASKLQQSAAKDLRNKISFVPPGQRIEGWCAIERAATITSVVIDPDAEFDHSIDLKLLAPRIHFDDQYVRTVLRRFQNLLSDPTLDMPGYAETLIEMLGFDLFRSSRTQSARPPATGALSPQQVRLVLDYIDAHLLERPTIAELAALVNLTRYHFMRSFKLAVGMPPHQFMIKRRVERAKEMLSDQDQTIAGVAQQTGFSTSLQLTRAFRRVVGTTPSEFRRQMPLA
jgi:AraC family transcriptional regulator